MQAETAAITADYVEPLLLTQGWAVIRDAVPSEWLQELAADFSKHRHEFKAAAIGKGRELNPDTRGDLTMWLEETDPRNIFSYLECLQQEFNRRFFWGLKRFECHLAIYPPGGGYERHIDNPHGQNPRKLTFLAYMNENWATGDGGELQIFSDDGLVLTEVEPRWNNWCFFLSENFPHQVLPSTKDRQSLSGWFRHDLHI